MTVFLGAFCPTEGDRIRVALSPVYQSLGLGDHGIRVGGVGQQDAGFASIERRGCWGGNLMTERPMTKRCRWSGRWLAARNAYINVHVCQYMDLRVHCKTRNARLRKSLLLGGQGPGGYRWGWERAWEFAQVDGTPGLGRRYPIRVSARPSKERSRRLWAVILCGMVALLSTPVVGIRHVG